MYEAEPERGAIFNSFMTKWKEGTGNWTDSYPAKARLCEEVEGSADAVLLVDIGGGSGHVLKDFVKDPNHRTGRLILQDLPNALGDPKELKEQGIEAKPYDFFTPQPIKGTASSASPSPVRPINLKQEPRRITFVVFSMTGQIVRVVRSWATRQRPCVKGTRSF